MSINSTPIPAPQAIAPKPIPQAGLKSRKSTPAPVIHTLQTTPIRLIIPTKPAPKFATSTPIAKQNNLQAPAAKTANTPLATKPVSTAYVAKPVNTTVLPKPVNPLVTAKPSNTVAKSATLVKPTGSFTAQLQPIATPANAPPAVTQHVALPTTEILPPDRTGM